MRHLAILSVVLLVTALAGPALANVAVTVGQRGGSTLWLYDANAGYEFTPNVPIVLTELGMYDEDQDGFLFDHPIGVWRKGDLALMASGILNAGTVDPMLNGFRYIDVADTPLDAGVAYLIGAHHPSTSGDPYGDFLTYTIDPAISKVPQTIASPGPFGPPMPVLLFPGDLFGPNFKFDLATDIIPAPGAIVLGAIGAALLGLSRRRRAQ
jgi:hypothetical protein